MANRRGRYESRHIPPRLRERRLNAPERRPPGK